MTIYEELIEIIRGAPDGTTNTELFENIARSAERITRESGSQRADQFLMAHLLSQDRRLVVDVGANVGAFTEKFISTENVRIHAFEPSPIAFVALNERFSKSENIRLNNSALSDKVGKCDFYLSSDGGSNSLHPFSDKSPYVRGIGIQNTQRVSVPVDTLDNYCINHSIDHIALLKLDVQSTEPSVLFGGRSLLSAGNVDLIQVEIILRPFYQDSESSFFQIERILAPFGYSLISIFDLYPASGSLLFQCDVIFCHKRILEKILFQSKNFEIQSVCNQSSDVRRSESFFASLPDKNFLDGWCDVTFTKIGGLLAYPESILLPYSLARTNLDNALSTASSSASTSSIAFERCFHFGETLERDGDHLGAYKVFSTLCRFSNSVFTRVAQSLFHLGDFHSAAQIYREVFTKPELVDVWSICIYGLCLSRTGGTSQDLTTINLLNENKNVPRVCWLGVIAELYYFNRMSSDFVELISHVDLGNHSRLFSLSSIISAENLARLFGDDHINAASTKQPITLRAHQVSGFSCTSLAYYGRFGHTLSEYIFLQEISVKTGRTFYTPDWVGSHVFSLSNTRYIGGFRTVRKSALDILNAVSTMDVSWFDGLDFFSPGENPSWNEESYELCRKTFTFRPRVERWCKDAFQLSVPDFENCIAIHLRLGDHLGRTRLISPHSYISRVQDFLRGNVRGKVYLLSDDIDTASQILGLDEAIVAPPVNKELFGLRWLLDFYALTKSQINLLSQSAFGYWGSVLNTVPSASFWQPDIDSDELVNFDPIKFNRTSHRM